MRGSTVLTSSKGFEEWGEAFGDDVMAAALIDRVVHHWHLVNIRGNSCRMRARLERRAWKPGAPSAIPEWATLQSGVTP